ncbi:MAG: Maf family protein [Dongiaceae bacterium]
MPATDAAPGIVLASASAARAAMLRAAGVAVEIDPARIDESEVKRSLGAENATTAAIAETLAELKAVAVSRRRPGRLVLGADQMLDCEGMRFDKPADRAAARDQLLRLGGRRHELVSAAVAVRDGERLWHHVDHARLTMRSLSAEFVDAYLDRAGEAALQSVGAYQLEGLGAQLFRKIEGDYFTILGLPLLPLLEFLRGHGVVPR